MSVSTTPFDEPAAVRSSGQVTLTVDLVDRA
jgi:hypothetical protein